MLSGTTAVTIDLTNLAAFTGVTSQAGDTSLSNIGAVVFNNLGTVDLTIAPGGSNPAQVPHIYRHYADSRLSGGRPGLRLCATQLAVDSTHKTITITPTSGGVLAFAYGGS